MSNERLQRNAVIDMLPLEDDMPDKRSRVLLRKLRFELRNPMANILARIPGNSVAAKARVLGIARQTYYQWLRGDARPNAAQARKLSRVTKIQHEQIRRAK